MINKKVDFSEHLLYGSKQQQITNHRDGFKTVENSYNEWNTV